MIVTPDNTTVGDICLAALKECGRIGVGQTADAETITDAWARLQWMLQQWERQRWFVYHLIDLAVVSTGSLSYTVGPGGQINTSIQSAWGLVGGQIAPQGSGTGYAVGDTITLLGGAIITVLGLANPWGPAFGPAFGPPAPGPVLLFAVTSPGSYPGTLPTTLTQTATSGQGQGFSLTPKWQAVSPAASPGRSVRPDRLERAFLRQFNQSLPQTSQPNFAGSPPLFIDYPLELLESREDYDNIALKQLVSFPSYAFYDSAWGLGNLFIWPVPNANIYEVHVTVKEQLPPAFATLATTFCLPYEYYGAILYNLALRLRAKYAIPPPPGDMLPGLAKDGLAVLRGANVQIARLQMPRSVVRPGLYNIFSDRFY